MDIQDHPQLVAEKEAIRRWVREFKRPLLRIGSNTYSMQYHVEIEPGYDRQLGAHSRLRPSARERARTQRLA